MDHSDAENMRGNHIYRAFNTVVHYGEAFHGIKEVACMGMEAAGTVRITPALEDPKDQRLTDTPMTDSFMQFAGFLVNYFNNPSMEDVFVCGHIEHIEIGGGFDPNAGEWLVYSTMNEGGVTDATADAYVFDTKTKKMVMAAFGFRFSKITRNVLARMLNNVNKSGIDIAAATKAEKPAKAIDTLFIEQSAVAAPIKRYSGKRQELFKIFSSITDIPVEELKDDTPFGDLDIDSLMAVEILNDLRSVMGVPIDLSTFLFFENLGAVISHVDEKLGLSGGEETSESSSPSTPTSSRDSVIEESILSSISSINSETAAPTASKIEDLKVAESRPSIISALDAFEDTRLNYDRLSRATGGEGFMENGYPLQARLVLAYVVEAFSKLGCDLRRLRPGDTVPEVKAITQHTRLMRQLYRILEDGDLILASKDENTFIRTNVEVEYASAESIYHEIIDLYPQHASTNKLVRAVGSEMAGCLRGDKNGLSLTFGNRETKKTLEEMYVLAIVSNAYSYCR